jgi:hypothetical protein
VTAGLVVVGLLLRRRVLDPRRFHPGDAWRYALVLPVAMGIGALGVPLAFAPVAGAVGAAVVLYVLVRLSTQPDPLPRRDRSRESLVWWGLATALALVTVGLAVWSTYQGLLDFPALPPPLLGAAS